LIVSSSRTTFSLEVIAQLQREYVSLPAEALEESGCSQLDTRGFIVTTNSRSWQCELLKKSADLVSADYSLAIIRGC
jgi:hypothetical protein